MIPKISFQHHDHVTMNTYFLQNLTQINACIFTSLILCKEELYFLYLKLKHNITNEQQNSSQKDSVSFLHLYRGTDRKLKVYNISAGPTNALELRDAISWEFFKQWVLFGQSQDKVFPGQN